MMIRPRLEVRPTEYNKLLELINVVDYHGGECESVRGWCRGAVEARQGRHAESAQRTSGPLEQSLTVPCPMSDVHVSRRPWRTRK